MAFIGEESHSVKFWLNFEDIEGSAGRIIDCVVYSAPYRMMLDQIFRYLEDHMNAVKSMIHALEKIVLCDRVKSEGARLEFMLAYNNFCTDLRSEESNLVQLHEGFAEILVNALDLGNDGQEKGLIENLKNCLTYYRELRESKAKLELEFGQITVALEKQQNTAGKKLKPLNKDRIDFLKSSLKFWIQVTDYEYTQFIKVGRHIIDYAGARMFNLGLPNGANELRNKMESGQTGVDKRRADMTEQTILFKKELAKMHTIDDINLYAKVSIYPGIFEQLRKHDAISGGYVYLSVGSAQFKRRWIYLDCKGELKYHDEPLNLLTKKILQLYHFKYWLVGNKEMVLVPHGQKEQIVLRAETEKIFKFWMAYLGSMGVRVDEQSK